MERGIREIIALPAFWTDVETLGNILKPVHDAQRMSESSKSHLGHVIPRWNAIRDEWQKIQETNNYPQIDMILEKVWTPRYVKQQNDLNCLAWALDPENKDRAVQTASIQDSIIQAMRRYVPQDQQFQAICDFFEFRDAEGKFSRGKHFDIWTEEFLSKPVIFWKYMAIEAPALAKLAQRVFSTAANSVPCERSFSMNFIQDEYRPRLSSEKTDHLTFIFMNSKVLRQLDQQRDIYMSAWYSISDEEEEALEDQAYEICSSQLEETDEAVNLELERV